MLGAAVAGQLLGTVLASRISARTAAGLTGSVALAAPAGCCLLAVVFPSAGTAALAVGISGLAGSLAKYSLDAALQTHVPPHRTSGAFARSETALQLAFALGGGLGLALPMVTGLGFALAAGVPALAAVLWARRGGVGGR